MNSSLFKIAAGLVIAVAMFGCSAANDNSSTTNASNKATEPARETKAADNKNAAGTTNTATTSTTTASSGDKVGVTECDEFLAKYETCIKDKVPAANRAALESSISQMRTSWKAAAGTPQGKAGLAAGCAAALNSAKTQTASYNCTW